MVEVVVEVLVVVEVVVLVVVEVDVVVLVVVEVDVVLAVVDVVVDVDVVVEVEVDPVTVVVVLVVDDVVVVGDIPVESVTNCFLDQSSSLGAAPWAACRCLIFARLQFSSDSPKSSINLFLL